MRPEQKSRRSSPRPSSRSTRGRDSTKRAETPRPKARAKADVPAQAKAKLFWTGRSQAVRLPKEFRFDGDTVLIHREGDKVILERDRGWPQGWLEWLMSGPHLPLDWEVPKREPAKPLDHLFDHAFSRRHRHR
jgi:antitoxin VapB